MTCPRNAVAQPRIPIANVFFQDRVGDQSLLLFGDKLVPAGARHAGQAATDVPGPDGDAGVRAPWHEYGP